MSKPTVAEKIAARLEQEDRHQPLYEKKTAYIAQSVLDAEPVVANACDRGDACGLSGWGFIPNTPKWQRIHKSKCSGKLRPLKEV